MLVGPLRPALPPTPPTLHRLSVADTHTIPAFLPCLQVANLPALKAQLAELEQAAASEGLWEQRERAQALLTKLNGVREEVGRLVALQGAMEDLQVAVELLEMEVGGPLKSRYLMDGVLLYSGRGAVEDLQVVVKLLEMEVAVPGSVWGSIWTFRRCIGVCCGEFMVGGSWKRAFAGGAHEPVVTKLLAQLCLCD